MRLIVASNRVAPIQEGKATSGGLAVAVQEALSESGGVWFGWSGRIRASGISEINKTTKDSITYATVNLNRQDYELYYRGYSNSTLWPLFHYRTDLLVCHSSYAEGYRRVNAAMAAKLAQLVEPDDLIWIHDYHLIPLAEELRGTGIDNRMGFFLHIPFPPPDLLTACSEHWELARNLMAYDVIGFQSRNDVRNFINYIVNVAQGQVEGDFVTAFGRRARVGAFPIGVYPKALQEMAAKSVRSRSSRRLVQSLTGKKLLIGVDRLDYSKGLPKRFEAYQELLARYPENRHEVTFIQIAPPSRSDVESYQDIRNELEGLSGRINGQYAEFDWVPIRYLNRGLAREMLTGFFRFARVGLVTPLRDGMNLVAKEYVASQDPEDPGVLVLSRFAGAAEEMPEALIVNPYDAEQTAESIQRALSMSREERIERWAALFERLEKGNLRVWRESYQQALAGP